MSESTTVSLGLPRPRTALPTETGQLAAVAPAAPTAAVFAPRTSLEALPPLTSVADPSLEDLLAGDLVEDLVDEDDEDAWGVDELDELEEEDSEDEGSEVEEDAEEEKVVKDAEAAEAQPVNEVKDNEIDDLADALGKTALK